MRKLAPSMMVTVLLLGLTATACAHQLQDCGVQLCTKVWAECPRDTPGNAIFHLEVGVSNQENTTPVAYTYKVSNENGLVVKEGGGKSPVGGSKTDTLEIPFNAPKATLVVISEDGDKLIAFKSTNDCKAW